MVRCGSAIRGGAAREPLVGLDRIADEEPAVERRAVRVDLQPGREPRAGAGAACVRGGEPRAGELQHPVLLDPRLARPPVQADLGRGGTPHHHPAGRTDRVEVLLHRVVARRTKAARDLGAVVHGVVEELDACRGCVRADGVDRVPEPGGRVRGATRPGAGSARADRRARRRRARGTALSASVLRRRSGATVPPVRRSRTMSSCSTPTRVVREVAALRERRSSSKISMVMASPDIVRLPVGIM